MGGSGPSCWLCSPVALGSLLLHPHVYVVLHDHVVCWMWLYTSRFQWYTMNAPEANLASRVAGEAAERQHLCDSCGHAPFLSSKTLHAHRTIHQTRGDVTLLNGLTAVITRPDEFSDWICPEDDCDYVSPHLLRLRSHLKNQSSKRRRQEEVAIAERAARDDVSSLNFSNGDASGQRSSSSAPSDNVTRRVRRRLDVDAAPPAPRVRTRHRSASLPQTASSSSSFTRVPLIIGQVLLQPARVAGTRQMRPLTPCS